MVRKLRAVVGKTVLLEVFADHARAAGWEPASLELQPAHNTDETIQTALEALLKKTREAISRIERMKTAAGKALSAGKLAVTREDVSFSISPGSAREESRAESLFGTGEVAVAKGRSGVVLLLDEAQLIRDERDRHGEHPLSLLIAPIVALQRRGLPVGLVVCGLPTLTANLQKHVRIANGSFVARKWDLFQSKKRSPPSRSRSKLLAEQTSSPG